MKKIISTKIDEEYKNYLEELAKRERRTLSQLVSIILEDWIKDQENKDDAHKISAYSLVKCCLNKML